MFQSTQRGTDKILYFMYVTGTVLGLFVVPYLTNSSYMSALPGKETEIRKWKHDSPPPNLSTVVTEAGMTSDQNTHLDWKGKQVCIYL